MSSPSIWVMNCGRAFSRASHFEPVVLGRPVAGELLHGRERRALRVIVDRLALGPPGRVDAPAQLGQVVLGNLDAERPGGGVLGRRAWRCGTWTGRGALRHCRFLSSVQGTTRRATRRPSRT